MMKTYFFQMCRYAIYLLIENRVFQVNTVAMSLRTCLGQIYSMSISPSNNLEEKRKTNFITPRRPGHKPWNLVILEHLSQNMDMMHHLHILWMQKLKLLVAFSCLLSNICSYDDYGTVWEQICLVSPNECIAFIIKKYLHAYNKMLA